MLRSRPRASILNTAVRCCPVSLQVLKVLFPVYYGAAYQCQKKPQHVFLQGMQHLDAAKQQHAAAEKAAIAAAGSVSSQHGRAAFALTASGAAAGAGDDDGDGFISGGASKCGLHFRSCAAEVAAAHQQPTGGVAAAPLLA